MVATMATRHRSQSACGQKFFFLYLCVLLIFTMIHIKQKMYINDKIKYNYNKKEKKKPANCLNIA